MELAVLSVAVAVWTRGGRDEAGVPTGVEAPDATRFGEIFEAAGAATSSRRAARASVLALTVLAVCVAVAAITRGRCGAGAGFVSATEAVLGGDGLR